MPIRKLLLAAALPAFLAPSARAQSDHKILLGIISIAASEANNARFIRGAQKEARTNKTPGFDT